MQYQNYIIIDYGSVGNSNTFLNLYDKLFPKYKSQNGGKKIIVNNALEIERTVVGLGRLFKGRTAR